MWLADPFSPVLILIFGSSLRRPLRYSIFCMNAIDHTPYQKQYQVRRERNCLKCQPGESSYPGFQCMLLESGARKRSDEMLTIVRRSVYRCFGSGKMLCAFLFLFFIPSLSFGQTWKWTT